MASFPQNENLAICNKTCIHLPFYPVMILLGIYPEHILATISKYISKRLFIEKLFVIAKY